MTTKCPCGESQYNTEGNCADFGYLWGYTNNDSEELWGHKFCPHCGAKLNPDGTCEPWQPAIERMIHDVTSQVPTCGLDEFALKCYNEIERNLTGTGAMLCYSRYLRDEPDMITLHDLFKMLNDSRKIRQKAEEAKNG